MFAFENIEFSDVIMSGEECSTHASRRLSTKIYYSYGESAVCESSAWKRSSYRTRVDESTASPILRACLYSITKAIGQSIHIVYIYIFFIFFSFLQVYLFP